MTAGWKSVHATDNAETQQNSKDEKKLPTLGQGERVNVLQTNTQRKQTKPPARYSEGTLIQAMKSIARRISDKKLQTVLRETSGLGQEATRASILETLIGRGFLTTVNKKYLTSTETGRVLVDAVPDAAKDPITTALWEQALDDIAENRISMETLLKQQSAWIVAMINQLRDSPRVISKTIDFPCPNCKKGSSRHKWKI